MTTSRSPGRDALRSAGPRAGQGDEAGAGRRARRNRLVIIAAAAAIVGVLLLQSFLHGHLSGNDEYDDGVYFGASLQLIHGIMPYRDFAFIQPPMISVILLPFAALSALTGTAHGFEAARIFIDLVTTANVALAGLLVRHRPTLQVLVSTGIMAAYPATVRAAQTVLLEPVLVLFCLAGLCCLFDGDRITTSRRRLIACGVLFGVAGATKLWAGLPFLAAVCIAWRAGPVARRRLVAGGAAGFLGCSLPFIVGSPAAFARQVFVIQAIRGSGGYPPEARLADLTGLPGLYSLAVADGAGGALVLAVVYAALIALCVAACTGPGRMALSQLDRFALVAAPVTMAGLVSSPTYYYHYAAFAAPFTALLYGATALRLRARFAVAPAAQVAATAVPLLLLSAMLGLRVDSIVSARPALQAGGALSREIPAHGCVLALVPALAILDNRFTGDVAGCPQPVDWLAQQRVLDHGHALAPSDRADPALQAEFLRWIRACDAVIAPVANPSWDQATAAYLRGSFHRDPKNANGVYVYVRRPARQE